MLASVREAFFPGYKTLESHLDLREQQDILVVENSSLHILTFCHWHLITKKKVKRADSFEYNLLKVNSFLVYKIIYVILFILVN